jgi:Ca2+-binding RTX toxin-like protein
VAESNTIGGPGQQVNITFTEYGSSYANNYISNIVTALNAILNDGGSVTGVSPNQGDSLLPEAPAEQTPIYLLNPSTVEVGVQTFDIASSGYVLDTVGGSVAVNGAQEGGDTVLVTANNPFTTVNTFGSDNLVVFIDGNNAYDGSGSTGGDSVVGGDGNDTIKTGQGSTTVNAGTGYDIIYLNDTGSGAYNDQAYLDTGHDLVVAQGTGDLVVATTENETIDGGSAEISTDLLTVVLLANSDGTVNGNDLINAGNAATTIFDESSANTISGGNGGLTFIAGAGITATFDIGMGTASLFGAAGDSITLGTETSGTGSAVFIAGSGNETLNGAGATGAIVLFGATQADSATANDLLTAGSGQDTLAAGSGMETLMGGAGSDTFLVDFFGAQGASITIGDFSAADQVAFSHYSAQEVQAALQGGQDIDGNFVISFAESSTTVTFTGITSASQLDGHIITF